MEDTQTVPSPTVDEAAPPIPTMAVIEIAHPTDDFLENEIVNWKKAGKPVSQLMLARALSKKDNIPLKQAEGIVEDFCLREEAPIPQYLSSEFGLVWLKVVAMGMVLAAMGSFYFVLQISKSAPQTWIGLSGGFIFLGLAAFMWIKSIANGG